MFKIKRSQSSNKTVRMPDELIAQIEKLASENRISFNNLVVQCCEYALDNLDPAPNRTGILRKSGRTSAFWLILPFCC